MVDVFAKCRLPETYAIVRELGVYPYYRAVDERPGGGEVVIGGRTLVQAGSSDYLGLSGDERVVEAAVAAARRLGTGSGGSRLSNGSLALHEELEGRLAAFLRRPAVMVTSAGYLANLALAGLMGPRDAVIGDALVHACLIDATRLAGARLRRYRHNDPAHLERLLEAADPRAGRLIVTEGMFSTSGALCDLPGIAKLARAHGARVVMDSAHDVGLLGAGGRGAAEHHGLEQAVDVQTLTFSKAFGTIGGAVAGPRDVIAYLRHYARPMVFTAALSPPCAAAALAALEVITAEPERRARVRAAAARVSGELAALGFGVLAGDRPVVAVPVGDDLLCFRLWRELFEAGVFTTAMIPPGVPPGEALIRVSVTAAHTGAQLDRIVEAFAVAGRRLGLL
ncbi:aminotransferase class I/II-fold pyridoxal phosphate-dependent enzyme [Actinomadura sp. ATCC 31491]|uniref:8-amino-7-oxononanoate synthase n=1 Tax=Actinomadura luzonensis TaxID=2805427 RepID=A0ABT0FT21_9ACTN|nr:aminotransferase class I/II-fold pyridoxal phosphate-dependent enzyme [Actinomadura luzonensis]MCK2215480.1 aminotransferase class I/II-fold pyridoxal phosphate-dependent enzyme [Actinomadura luzonensis]